MWPFVVVAAEALLGIVALAAIGLALAGMLLNRIGLPPALGYVAVGVAASPLAAEGGLLPKHAVDQAAEVGVLVVLFFLGLELDLKRLRSAIKATAFTTPFDLAVPAFAIALAARMMGWALPEAVALGLACAMSSTLFGERLSASPGTPHETRKRVLGVLLSEDVAAAALLAIVVVIAEGAGGGGGAGGLGDAALTILRLVIILVLLLALALLFVPRILDQVARSHVHELLVVSTVGLVALFGFLGFRIGSPELGALIAGVAAAEAGSRFTVRNSITGIRDTSLALFFLTAGLTVNLSLLWEHLGMVLLVAALFLVGKTLVHFPAALIAGLPMEASLRTAFSLGAIGEFSLVLLAAAQARGIAHPLMGTVVVGALPVLLLVSAVLVNSAPRMTRVFARLPRNLRAPLAWSAQGLRRSRSSGSDPGRRRAALRVLISNLLLLVAWVAVAAWAAREALTRSWGVDPRIVAAGAFGVSLTVGLPLLRGTYRAYRDLVWSLVGLRPGERVGAGKARELLVDAWVAATAALLLVPVSLVAPDTLPVLGGGLLLAAVVAAFAWRRLKKFHRALEGSVTRVLGHDPQSGALLDRVMQTYPWGVRFAAVAVPSTSPLARQSIVESRIGELTGAVVAVVQRRREEVVNPHPDFVVMPGDTLVLMGNSDQLERAEALVVAHGEALRMTAQSKLAHVEEVELHAESPWVGLTLAETDLKQKSGALVVGVWRMGGRHPQPYQPGLRLEVGDRLIIVGTELQVQRARDQAMGAD